MGRRWRPLRAAPGRATAGRALTALVLLLLIVAAPGRTASASTPAADSVRVVATPGIALHVPADGRLDGDGFAADIPGYRFAHSVGFGASKVSAGPGQQLLVFGLSGASLSGAGAAAGPLTATLSVDGTTTPLPPGGGGQAPTYYLASIPAGAAPVALALSAGGFAQSFSFTTGARTGLSPPVCYRAARAWEDVDDIDQTVDLSTPDPSGDVPDAQVAITLTSARLTWFGPDGVSDNPPAAGDAWLVLSGSAEAAQTQSISYGEELDYLSTLPGAAFTLNMPGRPAQHATLDQGGPGDEAGTGMFGGTYYFAVPNTLSSATLTITPGTVGAEDSYLGTPEYVHTRGDARFTLDFGPVYTPPAPPAANPPARAATAAAHRQAAGPDARTTGGGGGLPSALWVGVGLLIAVLGVAAGTIIARRRQPAPAGLGPAALGPGPATPELPWALPLLAIPATSRPADPPPPPPSETPAADTDVVPPPPPPPPAPSAPVLVAVPDGPPPLPEGTVEVQVLGQPSVTGWPAGHPPPTASQVELLAYLVLHSGRRYTGEQLRAALGAGREAEWRRRTIGTYAAALRRALGPDRVPEANAAGGYQTAGVSCDALRMAAHFAHARGCPPAAAAASLADGLALVRGAPFADTPPGAYGWADTETVGATLANAIHTAAVDLARLALDAGDTTLAAWAANRGLVVWPLDVRLHTAALDAAAGDHSWLARTWAHVGALFAANREPLPDTLVDHYTTLQRRHRA